MWHIDYYTEPSGRKPVAEWLDSLDRDARAVIMDKIGRLEEHGLALLRTNMMERIQNGDGFLRANRWSLPGCTLLQSNK